MKDINIDHIDVAYSDKVVIEDLSIEIPMGKVTTIIGPNGCGKSTLLKTIGRILQQKRGAVYLEGKDIHAMSTRELATRMAILPQSPIAPDGLTVEELISYGRFPYQKGLGRLKEEDRNIINWAIQATNLEEIRHQEVRNLSGGQRQRVWIAMALAQQTDIILLDEPTTYLDMAYQLEILELLDDLNKQHGCTIVMVLHDLNLAAKFADCIIAMKDGKIIDAGTPGAIMTREVLSKVYEIDANIVIDSTSGRPICLSYQLLNKKKRTLEKIRKGA